MGVLDFLFEGKPPPSTTTYGKTVKDVPKWMSDYTQGLIARANAVAAEPYQPYEGPRIAGFDPAQEQAFGMTERNVGVADPYIDAATAATTRGAGTSPLAAAQPYIDEASGNFIDPGNVEAYMNPYIENVLNRQESMATRALEERFIPGLQKAFVGSGQFGSTGAGRSMESLGLRGVRDISENLEEQRLATLAGAYGQAADIYGADRGRAGDLARTAGTLETAGGELALRGGEQMGALGTIAQRSGLTDAAAMEAIGAQRRELPQASLDLAYGDFREQRDYPQQQVGFMSDIVRGLPSSAVPSSTTTSSTGPAAAYQPSGLAQIAQGYGLYKGLTSARGGLARRYAEGGLVIEGEYEVIENG